jgi:beta-lactamase regulating signal transducer with metallopeptidase domain
MSDSREPPKLIESSAYQIMNDILARCHTNRVNIYLYVWNAAALIGTVAFIAIVLYTCYKSKPSAEEREQKMLRDQDYILSKIRYYKDIRRQMDSRSITGLPTLDTRPFY